MPDISQENDSLLLRKNIVNTVCQQNFDIYSILKHMNDFLHHLGLDKREYDTYQALLQLGSTSIRQIARQTGINRGTTHEILKSLLDKGLVSYQLKGKRRHYLAEAPEKLLQIAQEKHSAINNLIKLLHNEVIPNLKSQKLTRKEPTTRYYEGEEGIEKVLKDLLQTMQNQKDKSYFAYSAQPIRKYLYRLFPNFTKQRVKNGIAVKVIALGEGGKEAELAERKWLHAENSTLFSSYIIIYADKFAIISLAKNELPYAVVTHEPGIAQTQKLIFQTLWNLLKN